MYMDRVTYTQTLYFYMICKKKLYMPILKDYYILILIFYEYTLILHFFVIPLPSIVFNIYLRCSKDNYYKIKHNSLVF